MPGVVQDESRGHRLSVRCGTIASSEPKALSAVLSTCAVVVSWLVVGLALAGCGFSGRRVLARVLRIRGRTGLGFIDVWIGLGLLIAYVQIWSLFARVDWVTATAPAAIGVSGLVAARQGNRLRIERRSAVVLGLGLVALLWIANLSLAGPTSYDSGLYHFQAVEYASRFGAVPGLGDLSYRLGAGGAHFLFVALLGQRPWSDAGFHLANGFLVAALLGDLGSRLIGRRSQELISLPFTRLASRLLIPATVVTVASDPGALISSPSIDLPAFVLVAIGMLYVSESVERDLDAESSLAGVASLAAASATRPQFIPATLIALGTVGFVATRPPSGAPRSGVLRTVLFLGAIPTLVMVGWIVRQAVLSGYPLFPSRVVSLPLDWRLPSHTVDEANRYARSWARTPRGLPASVLGSWGWFPGWLSRNGRDINIIGALALLLCAVPVSVLWRVDAQRRERSRAMWAMLGPLARDSAALVRHRPRSTIRLRTSLADADCGPRAHTPAHASEIPQIAPPRSSLVRVRGHHVLLPGRRSRVRRQGIQARRRGWLGTVRICRST